MTIINRVLFVPVGRIGQECIDNPSPRSTLTGVTIEGRGNSTAIVCESGRDPIKIFGSTFNSGSVTSIEGRGTIHTDANTFITSASRPSVMNEVSGSINEDAAHEAAGAGNSPKAGIG